MAVTGSITVVMVNYGAVSALRRSLDCLEKQVVRPEKVILVDNTKQRECRRFEERAAPPGVDLEIYFSPRNLGFSAGNNLVLESVDTEFIALLNPDAFPEPDWLSKLLNAAEASSQYAAFGSVQLLDENPAILDGLGDSYHPSGVFYREGHGRRRDEYGELQPRDIFSPCAAAALYRRDVFEAVGGFDEDFFCYGEDVDLGFRLRLAGWKSMFVPDAVVRHVGSASSGGQRSAFASYHGHRNMVWVYVKNMPGLLFWLLLPLHILANLASMIVLTLRGQGKLAWRAKSDAIKGLPAVWKKRRAIQAKRVSSIKDIWRALSWRF